jgi:type I restriction enzyme M protein
VLCNHKEAKRINKVQLIDARKLFIKMRKSLGSKRNEISPNDEQKIMDEYNSFSESNLCKIFETTDFAYRQITIERPLKLSITIEGDKLSDFEITGKNKDELISALAKLENTKYKNPNKFFDDLGSNLSFKLIASIKKNIIKTFGDKDEEAELLLDDKGQVEADSDLRDTENVPYGQDIYEYFEKDLQSMLKELEILT